MPSKRSPRPSPSHIRGSKTQAIRQRSVKRTPLPPTEARIFPSCPKPFRYGKAGASETGPNTTDAPTTQPSIALPEPIYSTIAAHSTVSQLAKAVRAAHMQHSARLGHYMTVAPSDPDFQAATDLLQQATHDLIDARTRFQRGCRQI